MQKLQERLKVTLRSGDRSQILPDGKPGHSIVGFCLHQEALRVRNIDESREPRLITRSHLSLRCARRVQFLWRILSNAESPFERSLCLPQLPRQVLQGLIVTSRFGTFICRFNRSSRTDPEDVAYWKGHRQANPPVRTIRA